jgi:hypothetical protein
MAEIGKPERRRVLVPAEEPVKPEPENPVQPPVEEPEKVPA